MSKNSDEQDKMCFLCGELNENLKSSCELTDFSRTTIKALLETFFPLNLNNIPQNSTSNSLICSNCFIKLNELDEHQVVAEKIKSDFIKVFYQLHNFPSSNRNFLDIKNYSEINKRHLENIQNQQEAHEFNFPDIQLNFNEFPDVKIKIESELCENEEQEETFDKSKRKSKRKNLKDFEISQNEKVSKNSTLKPSKISKSLLNSKKLPRNHPKPIDDSVEIRIENEDTIFECKICNKIMKHRGHMQQHVLAHKNVRNFCCQECGMTFKLKSHLTSHYKTHTGKKDKMICDICGKLFDQKFYLREHMNAIHLEIRTFTCSVCFMTFARKRCLLGHARVHQDESLKKVICEVCGFRTHTKQAMIRHSRTHTGERNFPCKICGKMFACDYNVTAHVNSVHKGIRPKVDESKLRCNFCGRKFPRQKQLRRHLFEDHQVMEHAAEFKV